MDFIYNDKSFQSRRKELRNAATPEEGILWRYLKGSKMGNKFSRQISIGSFIVDFYCPKYKYVIELDGSQHIENREYDIERDNFLRSQGCTVRRFWNNSVHGELANVLQTISNDLDELRIYHP